jgi:periplasmic divalent cation tolerance protein
MDGYSLVYITNSSEAEAKKIARLLLESKLIACANIYKNISSIYSWESQIQESEEALIIAKTQTKLVQSVIDKVKSVHSYTCPCIISLAIDKANPEFLDWIKNQDS